MSLKPHSINTAGNFICGWYLPDLSICDELIKYHHESNDKRAGTTSGYIGEAKIDRDEKDSVDVTLPRCPLASRYIRILNEVARAYIERYTYCQKLVPWGVIEPMAIQHYLPGGGFKIWHFERNNSSDVIARRHLAFMTYLNDVNDGGGTEFLYQETRVKAEKGLTLVWPSEWTHTHKGEVSPSEEKYIITGWFSTYTLEEFKAMQQKNPARSP